MKNTAGSINYNPNGRGVPAVFSGEGMPNMLTGRFAPSPSGRMHLGNVFSALLAWLSVRSRNGRMLLRIEDLDPDRCRPDYIETLKRGQTPIMRNLNGCVRSGWSIRAIAPAPSCTRPPRRTRQTAM